MEEFGELGLGEGNGLREKVEVVSSDVVSVRPSAPRLDCSESAFGSGGLAVVVVPTVERLMSGLTVAVVIDGPVEVVDSLLCRPGLLDGLVESIVRRHKSGSRVIQSLGSGSATEPT